MSNISALSRQATIKYFRDGDKASLNTLISIAEMILRNRLKKYDVADDEVDDAIQDLSEEILKIVPSFDVKKSDNFIGYIFNLIKYCVYKTVYRKMYPFLDKTNKILARCTKILSEYEDVSEGIEQCKKMNFNQSTIDYALSVRNTIHMSIYDDFSLSEDSHSVDMLIDHIENDDDSIEDVIDNEIMVNKLKEIVSKMSDRDQDIIKSLYFKDETVSIVAKRLKLSPQRVDQLRIRALKHIRLHIDLDIGLNNVNVLDANKMKF